MEVYDTLDKALEVVASRSFYEPTTIYPMTNESTSNVFYAVELDGYINNNLEITYTDSIGVEYSDNGNDILDRSRAMEPYEMFTTADHIRYHMGDAIEALEEDKAVEFSYHEIVDMDDMDNPCGWMLVAYLA